MNADLVPIVVSALAITSFGIGFVLGMDIAKKPKAKSTHHVVFTADASQLLAEVSRSERTLLRLAEAAKKVDVSIKAIAEQEKHS